MFGVDSGNILAPVHSYTSQIRYSPELVSSFVGFVGAAPRLHSDSYQKIERSMSAAASAYDAGDPQVQLVSLWSAFEALLPLPTQDENGARIVHFVDLISPAIVRKYIKGKYRIFIDDLSRHSRANITPILGSGIAADERPRRLYEILLEDGEECDQLFSALSDSPLMLNRITQLFDLAQSPKMVLANMLSHEKRVRWQVHRIYRERNSIVHAGRTSPALPVLVENSFLYYRLVMRAIQHSWQAYKIYQPHGALQLIAGRYRSQKAEFKDTQNVQDKEERKKKVCEIIFS